MGFPRGTALGGYLLAVAMVAGCAPRPPYPLYSPQEIAGSYGFGEQRLNGDHYKVTYLAPTRTIYSYDDHGRQKAAYSRPADRAPISMMGAFAGGLVRPQAWRPRPTAGNRQAALAKRMSFGRAG